MSVEWFNVGLSPETIAFRDEWRRRQEVLPPVTGPAHVVIEDDNLEDEFVDAAIAALEQSGEAPAQLELLRWLKTFPEAVRVEWYETE